MFRSKLDPRFQVRAVDGPVDNLAMVHTVGVAEGQEDLGGELDVFRTIIKNLAGGPNWYSAPAASLSSLEDDIRATRDGGDGSNFITASMNNYALYQLSAGGGDAEGAMRYWDQGNQEWDSTSAGLKFLNNLLTIGDGTNTSRDLLHFDLGGTAADNSRLQYVLSYFGLSSKVFADTRTGTGAGLATQSVEAKSALQVVTTGPTADAYSSTLQFFSDDGATPGDALDADVVGWEIGREGGTNNFVFDKWDGTAFTRVLSINNTTDTVEASAGIKVGDSEDTADGVVRWTGTDFEGRKTGTWVSLTGSGSFSAEQVTLSLTDITNKYVDLVGDITDALSVSLLIKNAPNQYIGDDFNVDDTLNRIDWNGLGLDGQLAAGDKITIIFQ